MRETTLVQLIRSNEETDRTRAFEHLYSTCYAKVSGFLKRQGAREEEVEDIFQEALFIVFKNVTNESFKGNSSLSSYLFSISKIRWLDSLRSKARMKSVWIDEDLEVEMETDAFATINIKLINKVLLELPEDCQEILVDFYFKKIKLKDILKKTDLGSVQAIKNKKFNCMKKLSALIQKNKLDKEDFFNEYG